MNPHSPKLQIEYQPICQCDGIPALRAMALYQQQEEETRESPESKKGEWSTTAYGCPTIVSRSQWGGRSPTCRSRLSTPVLNAVIHHTEGAFCNSPATCSAQVRNIQNYHMNTQKWCDIGYNFLVGEDGRVYEGRGWTTLGAHARSYNHISIGISFIGSFTSM